jgi:RhtB (resistance to homoserine/threonine) family protein
MFETLLAYWPSILTVTTLQFIALISPGPDFAVVTRNSLVYSRRTGMMTALGIALGQVVHVSYILYGIGSIVAQTVWLFTALKLMGGAYLIYIGFKGVKAVKEDHAQNNSEATKDMTLGSALGSGFLTNVLNPKCMLCVLSLFTVVIEAHTPAIILMIYAVIFFVSTISWFSIVAMFFSTPRMRDFFSRVKHWIERVTGGFLILIGVRLALVESKI